MTAIFVHGVPETPCCVAGPLQLGTDLILAAAQVRTPLAGHLELADGLGGSGQPLLDAV
jgi:hypothetical protein